MLYFPVVQECETGVSRWIEVPPAGKSARDLKEPAPGVKLPERAHRHLGRAGFDACRIRHRHRRGAWILPDRQALGGGARIAAAMMAIGAAMGVLAIGLQGIDSLAEPLSALW